MHKINAQANLHLCSVGIPFMIFYEMVMLCLGWNLKIFGLVVYQQAVHFSLITKFVFLFLFFFLSMFTPFSLQMVLSLDKEKTFLLVNLKTFYWSMKDYRKVPKFLDSKIFAVSYLKFKQSDQTLGYFVKMVQRE